MEVLIDYLKIHIFRLKVDASRKKEDMKNQPFTN